MGQGTARIQHAGAIVTLAGLLAVTACSRESEDAGYLREMARARAEKDATFKNAADSPIPASRRGELLPLSYFPIDPDYSVAAILEVSGERLSVEMPTSTGQLRRMERIGALEFTLKGQPMKLAAFVEAGSTRLDRLFVPFSDLTSATETYPAGRYLDLDRTGTGIYVIDFNRAYHPYCYYNPAYDCPYPPSENRLPLPIRAGERLPAKPRT
jgi:uncharacterized protein (DUF1684 family)